MPNNRYIRSEWGLGHRTAINNNAKTEQETAREKKHSLNASKLPKQKEKTQKKTQDTHIAFPFVI